MNGPRHRRRPRGDGPALAVVTFAGIATVAALVVGTVGGVEECGYALFVVLGIAAIAGRRELADINRRAWTGVVGGTGERFAHVAELTWLIWGVVAATGAGAALVASVVRALA